MSNVVKEIKEISRNVYNSIIKKKLPSLNMPIRSLQNVEYNEKKRI